MEASDHVVMQLMQDIRSGEQENDFTGTPNIPVYVKLPVSACCLLLYSCTEINLLTSWQILVFLSFFSSFFFTLLLYFWHAYKSYYLHRTFRFVLVTMNSKIFRLLWQTGVINNFCQLIDPEGVRQELCQLKSLNVDGVVVDCWWGIVECWCPQKYVWNGYRELFNLIREFKLKLQVASPIYLRYTYFLCAC